MKMRGTGKDPLGRYAEGLIFDLEDFDTAMIEDFVEKGWAEILPPEEHPGRTTTQIAAAVVRGDALADPVEEKLAEDIEGREHAIVHLDDPDASEADYESEVEGARESQREWRGQIPPDALGGVPAKGKRSSGGGGSWGSEEKQPGGAAKS